MKKKRKQKMVHVNASMVQIRVVTLLQAPGGVAIPVSAYKRHCASVVKFLDVQQKTRRLLGV